MCFMLIGCEYQISVEETKSCLPTNAQIVQQKGNGWIIFKMDNSYFLYHKSNQGYAGYESVTKISPEDVLR